MRRRTPHCRNVPLKTVPVYCGSSGALWPRSGGGAARMAYIPGGVIATCSSASSQQRIEEIFVNMTRVRFADACRPDLGDALDRRLLASVRIGDDEERIAHRQLGDCRPRATRRPCPIAASAARSNCGAIAFHSTRAPIASNRARTSAAADPGPGRSARWSLPPGSSAWPPAPAAPGASSQHERPDGRSPPNARPQLIAQEKRRLLEDQGTAGCRRTRIGFVGDPLLIEGQDVGRNRPGVEEGDRGNRPRRACGARGEPPNELVGQPGRAGSAS